MFDVGFWELALIGAVALIIVGPERLPGVAHTVGLWVGKARRMVRDVKADIDREIREHKVVDADELKKDFADIKNAAGATGESLRKTFEEASPLHEKSGASGDQDGNEDEQSAAKKAAKSPAGGQKTAKKTVSRKKTAKKATSRKRVAKKTAKPPADSDAATVVKSPSNRKKTAKKTAKKAVDSDVDASPPPPAQSTQPTEAA